MCRNRKAGNCNYRSLRWRSGWIQGLTRCLGPFLAPPDLTAYGIMANVLMYISKADNAVQYTVLFLFQRLNSQEWYFWIFPTFSSFF